jgi:hypothetical protein
MAKIVDKAIWSIGPIFIGIAILLLNMCVLGYYLVVFPYLHGWTDSSFLSKIVSVFTIFFTMYIIYCIHFHYYMAIVTSPGDMEDYRKADSSSSSANVSIHFVVYNNTLTLSTLGNFHANNVIGNGRTFTISSFL